MTSLYKELIQVLPDVMDFINVIKKFEVKDDYIVLYEDDQDEIDFNPIYGFTETHYLGDSYILQLIYNGLDVNLKIIERGFVDELIELNLSPNKITRSEQILQKIKEELILCVSHYNEVLEEFLIHN